MRQLSWNPRALLGRTELPAPGAMVLARLRGLRPLLVALVVLAALAGLGVAHVTLRLRKLELGYAISRAAQTQAALAEEQRRLRIEVTALKSPERVIPAAREKLRLGPPEPAQIRRELP
jgi:cell division protein FtsL